MSRYESLRTRTKRRAVGLALGLTVLSGCTIDAAPVDDESTPVTTAADNNSAPAEGPDCVVIPAESIDFRIERDIDTMAYYDSAEEISEQTPHAQLQQLLELREQFSDIEVEVEVADEFLPESMSWADLDVQLSGDPEGNNNSEEYLGYTLAIFGSTIFEALEEYPVGFFEAARVNNYTIAPEQKNARGRYKSDEDLVESFESRDQLRRADLNSIRKLTAHEIGHGLFLDMDCEEDMEAINSWMEGIEFVGFLDSDATEAEREAYYESFPPAETFAYGPERIYPSTYAATADYEYTADLFKFTLEERGLIQEGDADYGSLLHVSQELMVDWLDSRFSGFREFVEKRTSELRRDFSLEIYNTSEGKLHPREPEVMELSAADLSELSQNGPVYLEALLDTAEHSDDRTGEVYYRPEIGPGLQEYRVEIDSDYQSGGAGVVIKIEGNFVEMLVPVSVTDIRQLLDSTPPAPGETFAGVDASHTNAKPQREQRIEPGTELKRVILQVVE